MIRWRYILTRVVVVIAVIVLLRYTLAPIAKHMTVRSLEANTGAKVEMVGAKIGLFPPSVRYEGVRITEPRPTDSMTQSLSADTIDLNLDIDALLHRSYVVRNGRVSGLKLQSDRVGNDQFAAQPPSQESAVDSSWISDFFSALTRASQEKSEAFGEDLEIVKRADIIRRRWKGEYALLCSRAAALEESIKQIQATAKGVENPLRDWPRVEATLAKTKDIQNELASVRAAIDAIPAKLQADLNSMQEAKQADIGRVDTMAPIDFVQTGDFGPRLLAGVVNRQVDRMREYMNAGREVAAWSAAAPGRQAIRGKTFDLAGIDRRPALLIQRCEVNGEFRAQGTPYRLTGVVENVSSQPQARALPFRARLKLDGPQVVRLDYARDDSLPVVRESLTMHWPELLAPAMQVGDADAFALDVQEGRMEVWTQVQAVGDQLQGRFVSRRVGTKVAVQSQSALANTVMMSDLGQTLANVDRIEIDADFSGSWTHLDVSVSSNLTEVIKRGLDQAVAAQNGAIRSKLIAQLDGAYQEQMAQLQAFAASEQTQARDLLARADTTIQTLSDQVLRETGAAEVYLGRLRSSSLK